MTENCPLSDPRAAIDRRVERALDPVAGTQVAAAHEAVRESEDRWYGELLVRTYVSSTDQPYPRIVLPAATAVELLRGYYELRSELLGRVSGADDFVAASDPTAALLAGDHLFSLAYETLGQIEHRSLAQCFETFGRVMTTLIETVARNGQRETASPDVRSLFDATAGSLGTGAAAVGATLAGADDTSREQFRTVGHGLATAREIRRVLDTGREPQHVPSSRLDERRLARHVPRRLDEVDRALEHLSGDVDVDWFRSCAADVRTSEE